MGKKVLITGGARSGKSRFAEEYAAACSHRVAYIATAEIWDEEMSRRVTLHQQRRPSNWTTWEAPSHAESAIRAAAFEHDVILFDCLTLYTTNLLLAAQSIQDAAERQQWVLDEVGALLAAACEVASTVIFVTNEVGSGIVPDNPMAREFRDLAGWVNQQAAAVADEAYLVVCGLAVELKALAVTPGKKAGN